MGRGEGGGVIEVKEPSVPSRCDQDLVRRVGASLVVFRARDVDGSSLAQIHSLVGIKTLSLDQSNGERFFQPSRRL